MTDTIKSFYNGAVTTTETTIYTAPGTVGNKAVVTEIIICNPQAVDITMVMKYNNISFISGKTIKAYDTLIIKTNSVLEAGQAIRAACSPGTVNVTISGIEVT